MVRNALRYLGHLEWLRFGVRDRIIRFLHNPDTSASEEFTVPFFGGTYVGNFDSFIDWSVYYYGAYAREELRLIDDFLQTIESPIVLDIGANVGHHTLFAAMRSKAVLAFEPFADVASQLERKVTLNKLANVQLFKFALGEQDAHATYAKPTTHNTGTGSFVTSITEGETLTLPIKNGDEVLAQSGFSHVHFIKIDTEGFEPFVLRGLRSTLAACRPLVFFEWSQGEKQLIEPNASGLFPANYQFYEFISDTVVFGFFRKPTYRLLPISGVWPDGNLFAVPVEYITQLRTKNPASAAAKKLAGKT